MEIIYRNALNVKRYIDRGAFVGLVFSSPLRPAEAPWKLIDGGSVQPDPLGLAVKVSWLDDQTNPIQDLTDTLA
jgi:hypothetical protein